MRRMQAGRAVKLCTVLSLMGGTVVWAQPDIPALPPLPPIEGLPTIQEMTQSPQIQPPQPASEAKSNGTTPATESKETSTRNLKVPVQNPIADRPAPQMAELPPLPPLPGMPSPAPQAESTPAMPPVDMAAPAPPPPPVSMPDFEQLPPIELPSLAEVEETPSMPDQQAVSAAPPPAPPAEVPFIPDSSIPEMEATGELPPLPLPPAVQQAEAVSPAPEPVVPPEIPSGRPQLTAPTLPELPQFTDVTEPGGLTASDNGEHLPPEPLLPAPLAPTETAQLPPPLPIETLPSIADLLEEKELPKEEKASPAQGIEEDIMDIAIGDEMDVETGEKPKKKKKKEIIWPRSFKTQTLPPQIYRKQYAGENAHLPKAQYYQEMEAYLFHAVGANDLNGMRALLGLGVPLIVRSPQGETLLSYAIRNHAYDAARLLLALHVNPNEANGNGSTPMHFAVQSGRVDVVEALLMAGGNPLQGDMRGVSPMQLAQMHRDPRMLQLLHQGAYANAQAYPADYSTYLK